MIGDLIKNLLKIISLFQILSQTKRAISAWIERWRRKLVDQSFESRSAVKERAQYADIGQEDVLESVLSGLATSQKALLWVSGSGGSGKSTLAFELARRAHVARRFVPVLVDFGWRDDLKDHVADILTPKGTNERPNRKMVEKLLQLGLVCVVVDGLSEIQSPTAVDEVISEARSARIRHLIVTSRNPCPEPELFRQVTLGNLGESELRAFVDAYVTDYSKRTSVLAALLQFSRGKELNALFARLAIDHVDREGQQPRSIFALIEKYLSSLRSNNLLAPTEADLLRACRLSGFACLKETFSPRDIPEDYLRGILDIDSSRSPFYDGSGEKMTAFALIETLKSYGILQPKLVRATTRLDFVHHPIAEFLAAAHVDGLPTDGKAKFFLDLRGAAAPSPNFVEALELLGVGCPA